MHYEQPREFGCIKRALIGCYNVNNENGTGKQCRPEIMFVRVRYCYLSLQQS